MPSSLVASGLAPWRVCFRKQKIRRTVRINIKGACFCSRATPHCMQRATIELSPNRQMADFMHGGVPGWCPLHGNTDRVMILGNLGTRMNERIELNKQK